MTALIVRSRVRRHGLVLLLAPLASALALHFLTCCNTAEGFGKDVKAAGNAVEDAAADAKPK